MDQVKGTSVLTLLRPMEFSIKFSYVGYNLQIDILSQKIDFVLQTLQALVKCRISSGPLLCLGGGGGGGGLMLLAKK